MPSVLFLCLLAQSSGHWFRAGVAWPGVEALTTAGAVPGVEALTEATVAEPGVEAPTEAGALAAGNGMARARVTACPLLRLQPTHPSSPSMHPSIQPARHPASQQLASQQPAGQARNIIICVYVYVICITNNYIYTYILFCAPLARSCAGLPWGGRPPRKGNILSGSAPPWPGAGVEAPPLSLPFPFRSQAGRQPARQVGAG